MKITLVIPFIDTWDITKRCIEKVVENTTEPIELLMIDNGSDGNYKRKINALTNNGFFELTYIKNDHNIGVLPTFKQAYKKSTGNVICFIHSDVLIQEHGWNERVRDAFASHPNLGLAGLFGAVGVGANGGRIRSQSNMRGGEWGKCGCHEVAWQHHSEFMDGLSPATILDGVGMFFSRTALESLIETDSFDSWRAIHHFYDRFMPLKLIDRGFKVATLGIGFDHWSGATANSSEEYNKTAKIWLKEQYGITDLDGKNPDQLVYDYAEQQFFNEFGNRIPCTVDSNWNYIWSGVR
jgi:glycosyltransferase involved in cell wall biosynthesis